MKLVIVWAHDDDGAPFVFLVRHRNLARVADTDGPFVRVRYVRPAGYWEVLAPKLVVATSRAHHVNAFGNLASAWRFARSVLH